MEVEECLKKKQDKEGGGGWSPSAHSERWDEKDRQDEMRGRDEMGRGDDSWGLPPNRNPNSNYGYKDGEEEIVGTFIRQWYLTE